MSGHHPPRGGPGPGGLPGLSSSTSIEFGGLGIALNVSPAASFTCYTLYLYMTWLKETEDPRGGVAVVRCSNLFSLVYIKCRDASEHAKATPQYIFPSTIETDAFQVRCILGPADHDAHDSSLHGHPVISPIIL